MKKTSTDFREIGLRKQQAMTDSLERLTEEEDDMRVPSKTSWLRQGLLHSRTLPSFTTCHNHQMSGFRWNSKDTVPSSSAGSFGEDDNDDRFDMMHKPVFPAPVHEPFRLFPSRSCSHLQRSFQDLTNARSSKSIAKKESVSNMKRSGSNESITFVFLDPNVGCDLRDSKENLSRDSLEDRTCPRTLSVDSLAMQECVEAFADSEEGIEQRRISLDRVNESDVPYQVESAPTTEEEGSRRRLCASALGKRRRAELFPERRDSCTQTDFTPELQLASLAASGVTPEGLAPTVNLLTEVVGLVKMIVQNNLSGVPSCPCALGKSASVCDARLRASTLPVSTRTSGDSGRRPQRGYKHRRSISPQKGADYSKAVDKCKPLDCLKSLIGYRKSVVNAARERRQSTPPRGNREGSCSTTTSEEPSSTTTTVSQSSESSDITSCAIQPKESTPVAYRTRRMVEAPKTLGTVADSSADSGISDSTLDGSALQSPQNDRLTSLPPVAESKETDSDSNSFPRRISTFLDDQVEELSGRLDQLRVHDSHPTLSSPSPLPSPHLSKIFLESMEKARNRQEKASSPTADASTNTYHETPLSQLKRRWQISYDMFPADSFLALPDELSQAATKITMGSKPQSKEGTWLSRFR